MIYILIFGNLFFKISIILKHKIRQMTAITVNKNENGEKEEEW